MKITQKIILLNCYNTLPQELLNIISSFVYCQNCYKNSRKHCKTCNLCNVNKKLHKTCKICKECYSREVVVNLLNILYYHIHCENCNNVKKYSMIYYYYYCENCDN